MMSAICLDQSAEIVLTIRLCAGIKPDKAKKPARPFSNDPHDQWLGG
jgi:hypothetical protein